MLRQSYKLPEFSKVVWIPSAKNPSDAFTKDEAALALLSLMKTNNIDFDARSWVYRTSEQLGAASIAVGR